MNITWFISYILLGIVMMSCGGNGDNNTIDLEPDVVLILNDTSIVESNNNQTLELKANLSKSTEEVVILNYKTVEGTAKSDIDYISINDGQILFQPGEVNKVIPISIRGEQFVEENEFFIVEATAVANATLENESVTISIINDDEDNSEAGVLRIPQEGYSTPLEYSGMNLVWQDEFEGDQINPNNWGYELGDGCPELCGWGNAELQYYRKENSFLEEGNLIIEAKKQSIGGKFYTSSRLISKGKQEFEYGRIDVRAVLPFGQGLWPAIWMLGGNIDDVGWPKCGEIDITELIGGSEDGRDNTIHGTVHYANAGNNYATDGGSFSLEEGIFNNQYHVFSIIWNENSIRWLIDDIEYHSFSINSDFLSEFHQPHYLLLNVAIGGNWPGSPVLSTTFPQYMIVDYVRVFQTQ